MHKPRLWKYYHQNIYFILQAYDNQISQLKTELRKEMEHEPVKTSVRPQIKQPKVSPPKKLTSPPFKQNDERSSNSSYDESAQNSPTIIDDKGLLHWVFVLFIYYAIQDNSNRVACYSYCFCINLIWWLDRYEVAFK